MFDMNPLKRTAGKSSDNQEVEPINNSPIPRPTSYEHRSTGTATIGPSINIKGELSGNEDLVIQGNVEGTITLKQNNLTIGLDGKVNANIEAHIITVEGTLKGDILGEDKVIIKKTGNVHGNISAPRVSLEDGAKFKGSMDMDGKRSGSAESRKDAASASVFKLDNKPAVAEKASYESKDVAKHQ
jgi:cytoskeletal protein CcmA (bactofilin family)